MYDLIVRGYGHYHPQAAAEYREMEPQHTALLKEANEAHHAASRFEHDHRLDDEWTDETIAGYKALDERAKSLYAQADQLDQRMRALAQQVMDAADAAGDPVDD